MRPASTFFRDARVASRADDRRAHERFAQQAALRTPKTAAPVASPVTLLARRLRALVANPR